MQVEYHCASPHPIARAHGWLLSQHIYTTGQVHVRKKCTDIHTYIHTHPSQDGLCKGFADSADTAERDHCPEFQGDLGLVDPLDVRGGQLSGQLTEGREEEQLQSSE